MSRAEQIVIGTFLPPHNFVDFAVSLQQISLKVRNGYRRKCGSDHHRDLNAASNIKAAGKDAEPINSES